MQEEWRNFRAGKTQLHISLNKVSTAMVRYFYRWDLTEWLERLTANAEIATVLSSTPAPSDTLESGGADEAVLNTANNYQRKSDRKMEFFTFIIVSQGFPPITF
jgi:hypothetical protein